MASIIGRSSNFKAAMRCSAANRTCPECHRKGALSRVEVGWRWSITSCRWCLYGYERVDGVNRPLKRTV